MGWLGSDEEDTTIYNVVVNHEEQYSIWPAYKELPAGWRLAGKTGAKAECLAHIKEVWTDMRPLSLRRKMEHTPVERATGVAMDDVAIERPLVDRLSEGTHPIEVRLRPEKSIHLFKAAVERNYIHLRFPKTRGGTELGVRLDVGACDLSKADLDTGCGTIHLEGTLTLDYTKVRCIADVQLPSLEGTGYLMKLEI